MRHALRQLARTPSFTTVAVLTLALGIAANTAIFAIVDELNFKPIAGTNLVDVYVAGAEDPRTTELNALQKPDFETLATTLPAGVAAVAATGWPDANFIQIPGRAAHAEGVRISGGYSAVFRLRAQEGRWISDEDNLGVNGADVIVISNRLWRQWFDGRPEIVGVQMITMMVGDKKASRRIIGVAAPGFAGDRTDFWIPLGHPQLLGPEAIATCNANREKKIAKGQQPGPECVEPGVSVYVRADAGLPPSQIEGTMTAAISLRPPTVASPGGRVHLTAATMGIDRLANTGFTILGFAALVFLGACANLANMLYARATEREGELAVRLSLGASRFNVFRLLMSEALAICTMAAAVGLTLAMLALRLFADAFPALRVDYYQQVTLDLSPDWRQFIFAAGTAAAAAVIIAAASLWRSSRVSLLSRLAASSTAVIAKTEGRTIRTLLVSVQITAAVLLLIAAGLYLENSGGRFDRRVKFNTSHLTAAYLELPREIDEARGSHYFEQLQTRMRSIDGVTATAVMDALPGGESPSARGGQAALLAQAPERGLSGPPRKVDGHWIYASSGSIQALGLQLIAGRDLQPTDTAGGPRVALVSESVAKGLWPGEDPIGKGFYCADVSFPRTVVGVVADPVTSSNQSPLSAPGNFAFLPAAQEYHRAMMVVARGADAQDLVEPMRHALIELDPDVPVLSVAPVDDTQFAGAAAESAARVLAGSLGLLALGISVLGVYAVVAYVVSKRQREFGLRLALGATRGQVIKLVVDHSIHMVLIGLLPAVLLASWGTRIFQVELIKLKPNGLTVWIAVPLLMLAAGIIAAYIPARRASRVPPNQALRDL